MKRRRQEGTQFKDAKRKKNKPSGGDEDGRVIVKPGLESSCIHICQLFTQQPEIATELTRQLRGPCAARVGVRRRAYT